MMKVENDSEESVNPAKKGRKLDLSQMLTKEDELKYKIKDAEESTLSSSPSSSVPFPKSSNPSQTQMKNPQPTLPSSQLSDNQEDPLDAFMKAIKQGTAAANPIQQNNQTEEDPLEAFMKDINKTAQKEAQQKSQQPKVRKIL